MEEILSQETDNVFKKYVPAITISCCVVCVLIFIGIHLDGEIYNLGIESKLAPSSGIFRGEFWGLITSNFVHVEIWHIAFNLSWLWVLGKKIEFEENKLFYVTLILSSALVSSLAQLAFSESTGIGMSGIVYALFGFLVVRSKTSEEYRNAISKKTINLFLFWLALCVILTKTGIWRVGNAAHIGGLAWGMLIAWCSKYKTYVQWAAGSAFVALLTVLIFYGPFSTSYLSYQAFELHRNQKVDEAIILYKKIVKRDPDSEFAKENLKQLEMYQLQVKAYDLLSKQKYSEARQILNEILIIDRNNQWARENLSSMPVE